MTEDYREEDQGLFYGLLGVLLSLITIVLIAWLLPVIPGATGIPHPEFKGILIAPKTIDMDPVMKWVGYVWGLGVIMIFALMLFIGNRKKGKKTIVYPWLLASIALYLIIFSIMVYTNWEYLSKDESYFFWFLPKPTAWMIFGMWFCPIVITYAYIYHFETGIISEEEVRDFHDQIGYQP